MTITIRRNPEFTDLLQKNLNKRYEERYDLLEYFSYCCYYFQRTYKFQSDDEIRVTLLTSNEVDSTNLLRYEICNEKRL